MVSDAQSAGDNCGRGRSSLPVSSLVRRLAVGGRVLWSVLLVALAIPAIAGDPRDIVFDCPCSAEWTRRSPEDNGELALTFGLRSFRATESGGHPNRAVLAAKRRAL